MIRAIAIAIEYAQACLMPLGTALKRRFIYLRQIARRRMIYFIAAMKCRDTCDIICSGRGGMTHAMRGECRRRRHSHFLPMIRQGELRCATLAIQPTCTPPRQNGQLAAKDALAAKSEKRDDGA